MSKEEIKDNKQELEYGADQITVLEGLEAVRARPGMYIGSTDTKGYHHLWVEIFDNSIDEALSGYGNQIITRLNKDGSVTVRDFGRGIPPEKHKTGKSTPEVIFTTLHAGGKFGQGGYKTSGGLHGVGSSVVNALSKYMVVKIYRNGKEYEIKFVDGGKVEEPLKILREDLDKDITGTEVTFLPDDNMFTANKFKIEVLREKIRESAYLNKDLELILIDDREQEEPTIIKQDGISKEKIANYYKYKDYEDKLSEGILDDDVEYDEDDEVDLEESEELLEGMSNEGIEVPNLEIFKYSGGISDFIKELNEGKKTISNTLHFIGLGDSGIDLDLALQWDSGHNERLYSYVNNVRTRDGGTHETGYKTAITRAVNDFAKYNSKEFAKYNKKAKKTDKLDSLDGEDIRQGLTGVISIKVPEDLLEFVGQTKGKLGTSVARSVVDSFLFQHLKQYLNENSKVAEKLVSKALDNYKLKKEIEDKKTKRVSSKGGLILKDKVKNATSKNPKNNELFIVEGGSAGGSAKKGRNRKTQGVLELRGKVLNVEQVSEAEMLENQEIVTMIETIGAGYGDNFDINKVKYHKVLIMTDADEDGAHIQILLLTFFYKYMRPLIEKGMLYIVNPPLYGYKHMNNKGEIVQIEYGWGEKEGEEEEILSRFKKGIKPYRQRYKGLGEMNAEQLYDTTMNPENRHEIQIIDEGYEESEESILVFMAKDTIKLRKKFMNRYLLISDDVIV